MATGEFSGYTKDTERRARLQALLIDVGTARLREIFEREVLEVNPDGLQDLLKKERSRLMKDSKLYEDQKKKLYPSATEAADNSNDFDIILLYNLLRMLCKKTAPKNWTGNPPKPPKGDETELAWIMRLYLFRNGVYAHIPGTALSQKEFEDHWDELSKIVTGLGGNSKIISQIKTMPITELEKLHWQGVQEVKNCINAKVDDLKENMQELSDKIDNMIENKVERLSISSKEPKSLVLPDPNVFITVSVQEPLGQITKQVSNVPVRDELEEGSLVPFPHPAGGSPSVEERPSAMVLSFHVTYRSATGYTYEVESVEQVFTDIQNQDFLENVVKHKEIKREYELNGVYMDARKQVELLKYAGLPQKIYAEEVHEISQKAAEKGAKVLETYGGCVILFLDFESKSRFENFWGFYSSGKLSDTVADLLATDQTSRLDSGDQLEVRAMVLEEAYIAWRDFFEKEEASPGQSVGVQATTASSTLQCSADTPKTVQDTPRPVTPISIADPLTGTDEPEEASHEQGATGQPTIHPEPPIAAFSTLQCSAETDDTEDKEVQGATALDPAAHQGQVNLEIGSKGTDSGTLSWTTEQQGSLPTVEMRISKGTDVNMEDEDGRTPLWLESKAGNAAAVEMLIAKGADVNKGDKKGRTPLWVASQNGHVSIVEMLITKGADANKADKEGRTPVWVASQNGHIPTIEMLISKGADVNKADEEGRAPLWVAAQKDDNLSTVEMLINKGANVNMADKEGRTSLWVASQNGCSKTVRLLISRGANVNMADNHCQTPLWVAAQGGHLPTVESLFREGADVNTIDEDAQTPLWIASQEGHLPVVEMLLRNGANVNVEDKDGQPPLWIAAQEGHLPVVERLLSKGAVVNVADIDHRTPLSVAAQWGHTPVVKMLLSKGAKVNMADKNGCTPLWIAALKGHLPTVEMLLREGADVNKADNDGRTPLWIALQFGQHSMAEVLRSYGAINMSENGGGRRASFLLKLIAIKDRYKMRKGDDESGVLVTKRWTGPTDVAKSMVNVAEVVH